jgi:hypothetical protein
MTFAWLFARPLWSILLFPLQLFQDIIIPVQCSPHLQGVCSGWSDAVLGRYQNSAENRPGFQAGSFSGKESAALAYFKNHQLREPAV